LVEEVGTAFGSVANAFALFLPFADIFFAN
jgi:hypothetical protein